MKQMIQAEKQPHRDRIENKQPLIIAGNSLLVFLAVYGTFGALVSSFSLPVNINVLFWSWLTGAVIMSMVTMRNRGKGLLVLSCLVLLICLFNYREIIDSFKLVTREITLSYSKWLPVSVIFSETKIEIKEPTLFIATAGLAVMILLSFSICLRRSLLNTVLITAPIVFLTFVITDLQADLLYLFSLIAVYLTLLICSAVGPDDYIKRGKVLFPALLSAMVIMLIAYMLTPHGSYSREEHITAISNRFRGVIYRISGVGNLWQPEGADIGWLGMFRNGIWQFNTENVKIADSGQRPVTNQNLLEITVDRPGTYYLRGYSMQSFDGRSWRINDSAAPVPGSDTARDMPARIIDSTAQINTFDPPRLTEMAITRTGDMTHNITYQPYYTGDFLNDRDILDIMTPAEKFFFEERNIHGLLEELKEIEKIEEIDMSMIGIGEYEDELTAYADYIFRSGVYTSVDVRTSRELRQLALDAGINPNAERYIVADSVANYIMSSGSYSLAPDLSVPVNENFVLYFLRNAEEGYCIHFATAAVLMLRSLDVPARFTSGYVVTVGSSDVGKKVVLTDRNAHAWVEVFYDDIGWLYLEVTPSGGNSVVPSPRPHTPADNIPATPAPQPTEPPVDLTPPPEIIPRPDEVNEPSSGVDSARDEPVVREIPGWVYDICTAAVCFLLCMLSMFIRRNISGKRREKYFNQKDKNKAAVYIWCYIIRLSDNETQPAEIEDLALKARFSQHRLTCDELTIITNYAKKLADDIYDKQTRFGRFRMKYIKVLY